MGLLITGFALILVYGLVAMIKQVVDFINRDKIIADTNIPVDKDAYEGRTASQVGSTFIAIALLICAAFVTIALIPSNPVAFFGLLAASAWIFAIPFIIGFNAPLIWDKKKIRAELVALRAKNGKVIAQKTLTWIVWVLGETVGWLIVYGTYSANI